MPVLLPEVVHFFASRLRGHTAHKLIDFTVGGAGHSLGLLRALPQSTALHGFDRDGAAVAAARARLSAEGYAPPRATVARGRWGDVVGSLVGQAPFHGALVDCGVSSFQLDTAERGFSFRREGPLDMRMGGAEGGGAGAGELVNRLPEAALARILSVYGEEPLAGPIAAAICARRRDRPLQTTTELAAEVSRVYERLGRSGSGSPATVHHPATRTFQALRMAVNGEVAQLEGLLAALPGLLGGGGLAAVITFHSLEDRLVKHCFRDGGAWLDLGFCAPSKQELADNPRSRSAKLRMAQRRGVDG